MQKILRRAVALIALTVASVPTWAQEASAMVETSTRLTATAVPAIAVGAAPSDPAPHAASMAPRTGLEPLPLHSPVAARPAGRPSNEIVVPFAHAAHPHDRAGRDRPTRNTAQASTSPARPAPAGDARTRDADVVVGVAKAGLRGDIHETRCIAEGFTAV